MMDQKKTLSETFRDVVHSVVEAIKLRSIVNTMDGPKKTLSETFRDVVHSVVEAINCESS